MNLRDLKYLVSLAEHRHFGKAAEICYVSQPALSMQIKKLEETLGVQLLERTNKSVILTNIGKIIAEHAQAILLQVDELQNIAKQSQNPYGGELRLGIFPTLGPYLLPHLIPKLTKKFPQLSIYLVESQTQILIESLQQGKLDVALLALPIDESSFTVTSLFEEEFLLAVPANHALAKRKIIKQSDLDSQTLLLLEDGHCMRSQALSFCHQMNATEAKNFRATSLETLRHMVTANVGITLIPKLACKPQHDIAYVPFQTPKPTRMIAAVWRTSSARKKLLQEIVVLIQKLKFVDKML
jgi:LysR family hydrogen peroxide-inducible transcriptional activator